MPVFEISGTSLSTDGSTELAVGDEPMNGRMARYAIGKPTDASAEDAAFVTAYHNSGNGVIHGALTATQISDWGLAIWANMLEASGNALEAQSSKDMTDNNTVTAADGPAVLSPPDIGADGNPIVEWGSKEGSSYKFLQATAAKRPAAAMGVNGINSETAVEFDGANLLVLASAPLQSAASLTQVLPIETGATAFAADQVIFATSDEATATAYLCVGIDSAGKVYVEVNDAATVYRATGSTVLSTSTAYLITVRDSGSAIGIDVSGTAQTIAETGSYKGISDLAGLDNTTLGALKHTSEVDHFEGKIAEKVTYVPTISAGDETAVESYADSRYAL